MTTATKTYTINYTNEQGAEETIEAETLEGLASALEGAGYAGGSIRVVDDAGWTKGWVSAGKWQAA